MVFFRTIRKTSGMSPHIRPNAMLRQKGEGRPRLRPEDVIPGKKPGGELLAQSREDRRRGLAPRPPRPGMRILVAAGAGVMASGSRQRGPGRLCAGASHQAWRPFWPPHPSRAGDVIAAGWPLRLPVILAGIRSRTRANLGALAGPCTPWARGTGQWSARVRRLGPGAARPRRGLSRLRCTRRNLSGRFEACAEQVNVVCATDDPGATDAFRGRFPFPWSCAGATRTWASVLRGKAVRPAAASPSPERFPQRGPGGAVILGCRGATLREGG
jgi:hypothetical protein